MYAKGKGSTVPSDAQAREKLALYVYEYLLHVGAQKSAQTFLSEIQIRWEKNITLGEPPGFLHSWWCVFWDLYCAAPERRETCDHSSEAKAFHDYGFVNSGYSVNGIAPNAAPSPLSQMPPQDGMPGGPMPPSFFPPPASQPSPHSQPPHNPMLGQNQPYMSPRYPGGPRGPGVRMPNQVEFNTPPGSAAGQMPMPNSMEPRPGHPGMGPMQRMSHPGGRMPGPMNPVYDSLPSYGGMRGPPPNSSMGPGGPAGMPPMSMPGGPGGPGGQGNRPWPPTSSSLNYSSASPGSYNGPPVTGPPGTPIMPSPQAPEAGNSDGMYSMMKPGGPGGMPGMPGFPMGPDGSMGPMGPGEMPPVMNGMSVPGDMDGMKNSPANGPGTPRDDMPPVSAADIGGYGLAGYQDNEQNESAAILKIKESMQEEAKRFEKDADQPEYFMQ
ncbi:single-stranded DNA-binding protein 3-like isoform X4 [Haliotis cracherodii]|uniref:single-stranded DNA-binding protein 3-like isoform X4 n=1 Tax=Haliotis rufescens TaxID=6454 RepID=UPI001EB04276|nr:single-stranded DNA-binding protein 3-like isoform X4 [Haliotis rufescens]